MWVGEREKVGRGRKKERFKRAGAVSNHTQSQGAHHKYLATKFAHPHSAHHINENS